MKLAFKLRTLIGYHALLQRIQNNEWENYDFTNSMYINNRTKLEVVCKTHGIFWIRPNGLKSGRGCGKCGGTIKKTVEEYIQQLTDDFQEFEVLEDYVDAKTKVLHKHKICELEWRATPDSILSGHGCPKCAKVYRRTPSEYFQYIEDNFKEFEVMEEYINSKTKILHKHKICGLEWRVMPSNILRGQGCPKCIKSGFDPSKPAILYYLSVKQGEAYKIGITNLSVSERYSNEELQDITIIEEWEFENGQEAYKKEQEILKRYKHLRYKGEGLLKSGNTELFLFDVLGLNTKNLGGFNG